MYDQHWKECAGSSIGNAFFSWFLNLYLKSSFSSLHLFQGGEIPFILITEWADKPGKEEAEPAFKLVSRLHSLLLVLLLELKYIGNVHGDEPVGRELLILLASWLCDNYMKDPLATLIVDNFHLHILPSMNPDGFSLRRRGNANNVDLNRDFPDQFFPMNDDPGAHQPETKAIMRWLEEMHFTTSASLHGGALVANYPWDGTENKKKYYYGCPDDETFRHMASIYSHSHHNMSLSEELQMVHIGTIYGGMQNWNYLHAGCFELTLEISDDKWPNASEGRSQIASVQLKVDDNERLLKGLPHPFA
ncbi:hypothetical protein RND71_031467 [Anisodus tanguticus]|uniref:Peptidase M14 domain-containing protein n=1 Tax=Anisodus tanguticus TaxID=243964 RepID=A0AAE1UYW9_9SOLA|nr:hypothetical protein RND71_031467 [Anisodus tanguticus]